MTSDPSPRGDTGETLFDRLFRPGRENAQLIYVLYLVAYLIPPAALAGLIMAYISIDQAEDGIRSHYRFQIRGFWIALLFYAVSFGTIWIFGLGVLGLVATTIWGLIRSVKGLQALSQNRPIADPKSWLFG